MTSAGALEGLGKGFPSLIISVCRYVAVIIPVAFIMSRIVGAVGVWHAFWITEVITSVISYMVYKKMLNNYENVFLTLLELGNTIVAYATIGGASNVEKNFFLYERI